MRELRGAGAVVVKHVGMDDNPADLFTKVLNRNTFEKHRRTILNTTAGDIIESARAARAKYDPPPEAEAVAPAAAKEPA